MPRTIVVVSAALIGVAIAGVLLGAVIPRASGTLGPGSAFALAFACAALAAIVGAALTRKTPPDARD